MEKNNEQIKNIWKPLCLVMAVLLALSWVFFGFLYSKGGVDFSTLENPKQVQTDNGSPVTDENGEELPSDETIPMPSALAFSSAAALDGANAAYDSVTLTATVKPDTADNKTVDWAVAFVNPSSAWANGKTVTDYVTVTPTSDGSTMATVQCLKDFGEQIKVTVTSRDNEEAKAECTVDFAKRVASVSIPLKNLTETVPANVVWDSSMSSYTPASRIVDLVPTNAPSVIEVEYSSYTLDDTFEKSITFFGTSEMLEKLKSGGFSDASLMTALKGTFYALFGSTMFRGVLGIGALYNIGAGLVGNAEILNKGTDILRQNLDIPFARLTVALEGTYSDFLWEMDVYTTAECLTTAVTNVSLDQSDVII